MKLTLALMPLLALAASADEGDSLMSIHRIETETADRIQARVLDPILGPGQSSVFVKLKLEGRRVHEISDRDGEGQATKFTTRMEVGIATTAVSNAAEDDARFGKFAFGRHAKPPYQQTKSEEQLQKARQTKGVKEELITLSNHCTGLHLTILHDAKTPQNKISSVRTALLAIYKWENGVDIRFHPIEFHAHR